jgi:hypothetical protein
MKLHLIKSSVVVLSLNLVACTTNTGAPGASSGPIATGATLAEADMAEYCRSQAASQYGAPPGNISTEDPVPRSFGSLVVGTAYTGQKTYMFNCRFDSSGNFTGISET